MRNRMLSLILGGSIILALLVPSLGFAEPEKQQEAPPILLKAATFRPALGELPNLPRALALDRYAEGMRGYYLVQFQGPVLQEWKDQVAAKGAEFLDYIPEFAFKVRMTPAQARQVESLESVLWVGIFQPAFKLNPNLIRDGQRLYRVRIEQGTAIGPVADAIARMGVQVSELDKRVLLILADSGKLDAIAQILDVAWVDNFVFRQTENEYGAGAILGASTANALGYDGSTQIVAVADTGLGGGTASTAHRDIPASRIVAIRNWPGSSAYCWKVVDDGAKDVDSGHGTHTAGSVLSGGGPNGEGKGTAPAARLVFQAVENYLDFTRICEAMGNVDGYYLIGLPDDLRNLFQQAYNDGARIHSNSWGSAVDGEYTDDAVATDDFMWNHPNFLVTTSAGNAGIDENGDGYVDEDSMGSPATAKNILTIGASEQDRQGHYECDSNLTYTTPSGDSCQSLGGMNKIFTYGEAWPDDYPANPIKSDPAAGNAEQMVAFSSRGPTDDGRIKPDVVAPGTYVLSNYSDLYQEGYDSSRNPQNNAWQYDGWGFPLNQYYKYMGGTSMSNPLVAGGAAVVRDYFEKVYGHSASAALVKAALINTAVDLLDENNDGVNDNAYPIPNNHEGWGRVNLANATDGSYQFVDEASGVNTNGTKTYQYSVSSSGQPFKVTLVWTDYKGSTSASKALVNDLDLTVTAPSGAVYRENIFSGGWSTTGGGYDRTNNVANVYVQSAASGTWKVEVKGHNVPNGLQPFALIVDGAFGEPNEPPVATFTYSCPDRTCSFDASESYDPDGSIVSYEWNFGDGNTGSGITANHTYVSDGTYTVVLTVKDNDGATDTDTQNVVVEGPNQPPVASFTYSCTGLTCNFDGSASDDLDGTIISYAWDFGDGGTGTGVTASHIYGSSGTYTVVLTVTDDDNATDTDAQPVTVSEAQATMHIGDLDGSSSWYWGTFLWQATVTIEVHDAGHAVVANATVSGTWSGGYSGSGECTTGSNGRCSITSGTIRRAQSSTTFTVNNVTHSTLTYQPADNHDPDGDSDGTSISISKP